MRTILHNIGQLIVVPPGPIRGMAMNAVERVEDGVLIIDDESIEWFGAKGNAPKTPYDEVIDVEGRCVVPGLIDCHTHAVYAGDRADEFTASAM